MLENLNYRSLSNFREIWTMYNYAVKLQLLKYITKVTGVQTNKNILPFYMNLGI